LDVQAVCVQAVHDRELVREIADRERLRRVLAVVGMIGAEFEHRLGKLAAGRRRAVAVEEGT
jgi:hypothetical protein